MSEAIISRRGSLNSSGNNGGGGGTTPTPKLITETFTTNTLFVVHSNAINNLFSVRIFGGGGAGGGGYGSSGGNLFVLNKSRGNIAGAGGGGGYGGKEVLMVEAEDMVKELTEIMAVEPIMLQEVSEEEVTVEEQIQLILQDMVEEDGPINLEKMAFV